MGSQSPRTHGGLPTSARVRFLTKPKYIFKFQLFQKTTVLNNRIKTPILSKLYIFQKLDIPSNHLSMYYIIYVLYYILYVYTYID